MLILASGSPRRREILTAAALPFTVRVPNIPEEHRPGEAAEDFVIRLARAKASAVERAPTEAVLAADTVVILEHRILGKPRDAADARDMLTVLSGRRHEVMTGICLQFGDRDIADLSRTAVTFSSLSDDEISAYVATGEPMDKAGAYAIQGVASRFVERVEGCYFNVVGLPVSLVYKHLKEIGFLYA